MNQTMEGGAGGRGPDAAGEGEAGRERARRGRGTAWLARWPRSGHGLAQALEKSILFINKVP